MTLDSFVKTLDDSYIRYHYDEYKWRKTEHKKCFNGRYFVDKTELNKMLKETGKGESWFHVHAKKMRGEIIEELIQTVKQHSFCEENVLDKYVIKLITDSKPFLDALMSINLDFTYEQDRHTLVTQILKLFETIPEKDLSMTSDEKKAGIYKTAKAKLNFETMLDKVLHKSLLKKELKEIHDLTFTYQLKHHKVWFENETSKLFPDPFFKKSDKKALVTEIFDKIKDDAELKYHLSFFLDYKL